VEGEPSSGKAAQPGDLEEGEGKEGAVWINLTQNNMWFVFSKQKIEKKPKKVSK